MTWIIRLLRSAESDIAEAATWYREQEPGLDRKFIEEVDACINRIRRGPDSYAKRRREYRAAMLRRFPYTVYYRTVGTEIRIVAVLHHRRGPKARERRLRAGRP